MKDLSERMLNTLMDCHERQILKSEPLGTYYCRYSKGLLIRGLITVKPFLKDGKNLMAFFITQAGIQYLDEMDKVS